MEACQFLTKNAKNLTPVISDALDCIQSASIRVAKATREELGLTQLNIEAISITGEPSHTVIVAVCALTHDAWTFSILSLYRLEMIDLGKETITKIPVMIRGQEVTPRLGALAAEQRNKVSMIFTLVVYYIILLQHV